ncbi:MAG TPA: GEVED domain-containing protein [Thermoanaerobaculia bacterium]|nr:GEVED domain-containing protein [Thermoanaerobaculia bacterium]
MYNAHPAGLRRLARCSFFLSLVAAMVGPAAAQDVTFTPFELPPGGSVTIEFEVTIDNPPSPCATAVQNQGSVAATGVTSFLTDDPDVVGPANPTVTQLIAVDLAVTKTDGATTEIPGTPVTYTITVSNSGPSTATNATVTDVFPGILSGVTWTCSGAGGGTCTAAGAGNINDTVTIPMGGSVTYIATGNISAGATGTLVNTASAAAAAGTVECNLVNNSATDTDTLAPEADLSITKTNGVTSVNAGAPTTYTIVVSNGGPSNVTGASVSDTFPASLISITWTCAASPGSSCTAAGAGNIGDSVNLLAGGTATYTVNATVDPAATGTLSNTATVSAPGGVTDPNGANNSATDGPDTIVPQADVAVTKSDSPDPAVPGMTVTYTIVASNNGPGSSPSTSVADTFPATLTCSWTCTASGGSSCTAGPVAGNISDTASLAPSGTATYVAVCDIADNATGSLSNTVTVTAGGGVIDPTPGNNSDTETTALRTLDFGDAPDDSLAAPSGYPTLLADNGARHGITTLKLGAQIDAEADGQPTVDADGDDQVSGPNVDDEDGVTLPATLIACETVNVTVNASAPGKLDAWIDFEADGDFTGTGEQVVTNLALVAGNNVVPVAVSCAATPAAKTFARFRFSTAGGLTSEDVAADGEVEDFTVAVRGLDFGDAPDPAYPTLFASNGARHVVTGSLFLGAIAPDVDNDATPNATATGDDITGLDDEDGVTFTSPLVRTQLATVTVTASGAGLLDAWLDFNGDGNFTTTGDRIFTGQAVVAGANNLSFTVPATATTNLATVSRFRLSTAGSAAATGLAADGEVEDHAVATAAEFDVAVTKTDGAASEIPGTPIAYTIVVSNTGPDAANGTSVTDTFPAALTGCSWTSVAAGGATGNTVGLVAGNIGELLNLPAGSSVTYNVGCTIDPAATGNLVNTVTATSPLTGFDTNPANNTATDTDTLTPQADASVTKNDGSATEIPGTPVTYTIAVANAGPSTATAVSVSDTFPAALTGCSWSSLAAGGATGNTAGPVAGNIAETGLTLPPASSVTYTATCNVDPAARGSLINTATVASATADPTPGNNSATDTDTLVPQVDLVVGKTESIDPVIAGSGVGNLTYVVTVTNAGPSTATTVTLSEVLTLPAGVTLVSATPSQGTFTSPGWAVGTLAPNGSATLTVVLTAGPSAANGTDTICDTATVTGAAETLINTGDDAATLCTSVARRVDMVVGKTESIDPVVAGSGAGNLTYVVTVTNNGPSDASGITLSEVVTVPAGVTVDSVTPSQGSFVSPNWTVGNLAAGASATLTVVLTASSAASPGTDVICDTATLTAVNEVQVATGNEADTECTSITVSADLSITKVDDADPPPAGSNLTYTITVTNGGPSNATGVVVTDTLPAAVTYVSDTCGASNVPPWTWNIGNLANGASVSCDVVVSINPTPPASITNTATVTATTNDANTANNSDSENTTLDAIPPQVTLLSSVGATPGPDLAECETANVDITQLLITFSEDMNDPVGDTDPDDVTNPANYQLITAGEDFSFDTTICGAPAGDDASLSPATVTYSAGTDVATLSFGGELPDARYRLLACGTLTDLAGNPLDGNGTAPPGDDFTRSFRVDSENLLANGHFDCTLTDWTVTAATAGEVVWNADDSDGSTNASGSSKLTNLMPGIDTTFGLSQCVAVPAPEDFDLTARLRLTAAVGVNVSFVRSCQFFSAAACGGSNLGGPADAFLIQDTGGTWLTLSRVLSSPASAVSARCSFRFETPTGVAFDGRFDQLGLRARVELFSDGFETGDTSAWGVCVGAGCP